MKFTVKTVKISLASLDFRMLLVLANESVVTDFFFLGTLWLNFTGSCAVSFIACNSHSHYTRSNAVLRSCFSPFCTSSAIECRVAAVCTPVGLFDLLRALYCLRHFCEYGCLSTCNKSRTAGRVFIKFDIANCSQIFWYIPILIASGNSNGYFTWKATCSFACFLSVVIYILSGEKNVSNIVKISETR